MTPLHTCPKCGFTRCSVMKVIDQGNPCTKETGHEGPHSWETLSEIKDLLSDADEAMNQRKEEERRIEEKKKEDRALIEKIRNDFGTVSAFHLDFVRYDQETWNRGNLCSIIIRQNCSFLGSPFLQISFWNSSTNSCYGHILVGCLPTNNRIVALSGEQPLTNDFAKNEKNHIASMPREYGDEDMQSFFQTTMQSFFVELTERLRKK